MKTILVTTLLFSSLLCSPIQDPYFPVRSKAGDPGISEFAAKWYGKSLERMNEPRLPNLAKNANAFVLRILILPTWGNSIAVRIEKQGEVYRLAARRLDGQAGYDPGKLVEARDVDLGPDDSKQLDALIENVRFLEMPIDDGIRGFDGDEWILEGVSRGKYHVVQRWCATRYEPDKRKLRAFVNLFRFLLDRSALSSRPSNKGYRLL